MISEFLTRASVLDADELTRSKGIKMLLNKYGYGVDDNSYKAAGELAGIEALVHDFYVFMDTLPEAKNLRAMHAEDLSESSRKLAYFLCGWLGGPRLYATHYGEINIPGAHRHLAAKPQDRDAWMLCMQFAIDKQDYTASFKHYLYEQLAIPANRVVEAGNASVD